MKNALKATVTVPSNHRLHVTKEPSISQSPIPSAQDCHHHDHKTSTYVTHTTTAITTTVNTVSSKQEITNVQIKYSWLTQQHTIISPSDRPSPRNKRKEYESPTTLNHNPQIHQPPLVQERKPHINLVTICEKRKKNEKYESSTTNLSCPDQSR
jgi:hypothetical protein